MSSDFRRGRLSTNGPSHPPHQSKGTDNSTRRQPWGWLAAVGGVVALFIGGYYVLKPSVEVRPKESETQQEVAQYSNPHPPVIGVLSVNGKPSSAPASSNAKELSAEAIFATASPAVVRVEVRDRSFKLIGHGSGFLVSEEGLVATNHHVIQSAYFAHVVFPDGSKYPVEGVAASQPSSDLALLKVKRGEFPVLQLAGDELPAVGSKVYAIGNPQGLTNSLSDGLVSGHRQLDDSTLIQTTAPISPGSSGGPLFSKNGQVVGVTTATIRGGQNLNLVIPVRVLKEALKKRGKLQTLASAGAEPLKRDDADRLNEVWVAIDKKDFTKALKLLALLQESQKGSAVYWFCMGVVQSQLENHDLAIGAWQASLRIDPSDETAF